MNFGPFVWVSAGATAAAATPPLPAAVREKEGEREPRRLSFVGTRGELEEDEGRFKHVSKTFHTLLLIVTTLTRYVKVGSLVELL